MDFLSAKDTALKWSISERRVQKLCKENRIAGVQRLGKSWAIPKNAPKPADKRKQK